MASDLERYRPSRLFGRQRVMNAIGESSAGLVVVAGDSGVGKSEVLGWAQGPEEGVVATSPTGVRSAPGALQRGLLSALSELVATVTADESSTQRVGQVIVETAQRLAHTHPSEVAAAVGKHILGVVRSRVSPELASLLEGAAHELLTTERGQISSRIAGAYDRDIVDVFLEFLPEVQAMFPGQHLRLILDDCQQLDEADQRRLCDLAQELPGGVSLLIAVMTSEPEAQRRLGDLDLNGARVIGIGALDEEAVEEWLTTEGLDSSLTPAVMRITNGYAVFVEAAVGLLRDDPSQEALDRLEDPRRVLATQTERAWDRLELPAQVAVARLAALSLPITSAGAAELLGLELPVWSAVERKLVQAGLFTGHPPWFHELRRRFVWDHLLSDPQRDDALARATSYLESILSLPTPDPDAFVEFATLVPDQPGRLASNPQLAAVTEADPTEVAIVASLIELMTPTPSAFMADVVLTYARDVFGAGEEVIPALSRLADRGLVHLESNEFATAVVPIFGSAEVTYLIAGRAARELRRLPVPRVATAAFEMAIRPLLGDFRSAHYGVGSPSLAEMSKQGVDVQRHRPDGSLHFGRLGPNLLVRLRLEEVPLYATVAYEDVDQRNAALERVALLQADIWGHPLFVTSTYAHPLERIPSLRFYRAVEFATGQTLASGVTGPRTVPKRRTRLALDDEIRRRAALLEAVRDLSSGHELLAYGLEDPVGYVYAGDETSNVICQISGRRGAQRLPVPPTQESPHQFHRLELAALAGVGRGERLTRWTQRWGRETDEPVLAELSLLHKRAAAFNAQQERVRLAFEAEALSQALTEAMRRAGEDAGALRAAIGELLEGETFDPAVGMDGRTEYVTLVVPDSQGPFLGLDSVAYTTWMPNREGRYRGVVRILSASEVGSAGGGWDPGLVETGGPLFGIDGPLRNWSMSDASSALAEVLGFLDSDVHFIVGGTAA